MQSLEFTSRELDYLTPEVYDNYFHILIVFRFLVCSDSLSFLSNNRIRAMGRLASAKCCSLFVLHQNLDCSLAKVISLSGFARPFPSSVGAYLAVIEKENSPLNESSKKLKIGLDTPEQLQLNNGSKVRLFARITETK